MSLAAGAALLPKRAAAAQPAPGSFVDRLAVQQIADRDPALRPPLLIDMQTHVWWRANGPRTLTDRGEHFLKALAGSRTAVVGRPVPVADMGRVMFFEDVLLESQTDVAFLTRGGFYSLNGPVAHTRIRDDRPAGRGIDGRIVDLSMRAIEDRRTEALPARTGHPRLEDG